MIVVFRVFNRIFVLLAVLTIIYWAWKDKTFLLRLSLYFLIIAGIFGLFEIAASYTPNIHWAVLIILFVISVLFVVFGGYLVHIILNF